MKVFIFLSVVAVAFANQCGENEHFESCGTACPLTCNNYFNPPRFCILRCDIGCQCDEGYVRNEADGRCVKPQECPTPKCGENEHFETCGTACPLRCNNYKDAPLRCVLRCDIGCHCDTGYLRNSEEKCVRPADCPETSQRIKTQNSNSACFLPAETGVCRGAFPRFFFDGVSGRCEKFIYGGCGGNENNFETEEDCLKRCASSAPKACLQDKETGLCKAYFPRYYFNKESGKCERFVYGGCGGNSNNFQTQEECEAVCQS